MPRRPRVLLDLNQASEHLARHPKYLRRLVATRRIKFYKLDGRLRFDQADLDAFLDACAVEPLTW